MNSSRDIVHNLGVLANLALVQIGTGATTIQTASVDMAGFNAVMFALTPSRAIAAADVISYSFQHSDNDSDWENMNGLSDLPPRLKDESPENPLKVVTLAGFKQTFGVFSHKRYVRVQFVGIADTTVVDLVLTPVLRSDISEFTAWDPDQVPNDGLD
jgi:hypothetical protein